MKSDHQILICRTDYITHNMNFQSGVVQKKINAKHCISSIPQELHIIKTQFCISSSRQNTHFVWWDTTRLCRVDDIPSLSAWIKKLRTSFEVLDFLAVRLILEPCVLIYKELKKQKHLEYISCLNNYFTWIKSPSLSATSPSNVFSPISDMYKIILLSSPSYSSVTYLIFKYWPLCVTTPPWDALIL